MTVVDTNPTPALDWAQEPDISARSTLVTILGDTVAPLGGTVWLSHLIALTEPFGFSDRLVRTSLFRLAAEGWVSNERVGRQSRYSLTDYGRRETEAAEQRIYRRPSGHWDGWWTLVFLAPDGADSDAATRHLRWRGFARLADGVQARPGDRDDIGGAAIVLAEIIDGPHKVGTFRQGERNRKRSCSRSVTSSGATRSSPI